MIRYADYLICRAMRVRTSGIVIVTKNTDIVSIEVNHVVHRKAHEKATILTNGMVHEIYRYSNAKRCPGLPGSKSYGRPRAAIAVSGVRRFENSVCRRVR